MRAYVCFSVAGGWPIATFDCPSPKSMRHCSTFGEESVNVTASGGLPESGAALMPSLLLFLAFGVVVVFFVVVDFFVVVGFGFAGVFFVGCVTGPLPVAGVA